MTRTILAHLFADLMLVFASGNLTATPNASPSNDDTLLKVYIQTDADDLDYIRSEITFVDHVRDRNQADVFVMTSMEGTPGGGARFYLYFIGQQQFTGLEDTLTYFAPKGTSEQEILSTGVRLIKLGLMRYIARIPTRNEIQITSRILAQNQDTARRLDDPWDQWVFTTNLNGYVFGEQTYRYGNFSVGASANRTTESWKFKVSGSASYNETWQKADDQVYLTIFRSQGASGLLAKSLGEHWSVGVKSDVNSSLFSNKRLGIAIGPAVEYNLFPYSQSARQQIRIQYHPNLGIARYYEETLYDKLSESHFRHALSVNSMIREQWGSVEFSVQGSQFLDDLALNRLEVYTDLSLPLFEGLSFTLSGGYNSIHDQISLPKRGASTEDVLLRRRQLASSYNYWSSLGLSYSFGSIYNNVVNPRFD